MWQAMWQVRLAVQAGMGWAAGSPRQGMCHKVGGLGLPVWPEAKPPGVSHTLGASCADRLGHEAPASLHPTQQDKAASSKKHSMFSLVHALGTGGGGEPNNGHTRATDLGGSHSPELAQPGAWPGKQVGETQAGGRMQRKGA